MTALAGVGAYVPRFGLDSETIAEAWDGHDAAGIDRVAVPDGDEDTLTLAWEAATRALTAAGRDADDVDHLALATTTPPIEETDLVVRLGSLVGVPSSARRSYTVASSRGWTDALCTATHADASMALVVAADVPRGDPGEARGQAAGAGAGAVVLEASGPGKVVDTAHAGTAAPGGRFRRPDRTHSEGLDVTAYDRDTFRQTVIDAIEGLEGDPAAVDAVALHARDGKRPYRLADALGVDAETIHRGTAVHSVGYTAAAGVPIGLARALEAGASTVLAVGYGAGAGADALVLETEGVPLEASLEPTIDLAYTAAMRRRGELDGDEPAGGGAYVSMPAWRRSLPQRHRLEAGRCVDCGALAFPPEGACDVCGEPTAYESVTLSGRGTVAAVTSVAGGAPPEFDAYQSRVGRFQTAIVEFDAPAGDDAVGVPAMVVSDAEVAVGDHVRSVVRRLYTQEGVPRYGLKVRPTDGPTPQNNT